MKRFSFWKYLLLVSIILHGCSKDNQISNEQISIVENEEINDLIQYNQHFLTVGLDDVPARIRESVDMALTNASQIANKSKDDITISSIKVEKAIIGNYDNGTSYTLLVDGSGKGSDIGKDDGEEYFDNLVVQELNDGSLITNIVRYTPSEQWRSSNMDDRSYSNYSGDITIYDEYGFAELGTTFVNGEIIHYDVDTMASSTDCSYEVSYTIGCVYTCWINSVHIVAYCTDKMTDDGGTGGGSGGGSGSGSGGGGGGSGSRTTTTTTSVVNINTTILDPEYFFEYEDINENPPSCESFNFQPDGTNNQESVVKGIYFNIILISTQYPYVHNQYQIKITNGVRFTAPMNLTLGGDLSSGSLAEVSAAALNQSMRETAIKYANKKVDPNIVLSYFKQRITYNYPRFVPGGRAQTNPSTYVSTPTNYKVSYFGYGNCN